MKCNQWLIKKPNRKARYSGLHLSQADNKSRALELLENSRIVKEPFDLELCDGILRVEVEMRNEPYFGGYGHVVEVELKCLKCGCTVLSGWPGLEGSFDLKEVTDIVQNYLDGMTE